MLTGREQIKNIYTNINHGKIVMNMKMVVMDQMNIMTKAFIILVSIQR